MDPLIEFATRNSEKFPSLTYDHRYVYETDSYTPDFRSSVEPTTKLYVNPDLLGMLEEEKNSIYVPSNEKDIVLVRANPFIKIPTYVKDAEMKVFKLLFKFKGTVAVRHPNRRHIHEILNDVILNSTPNNVLFSMPSAFSEVWMHFVYLLTKLFRRVTLLQLAMSNVRYAIAMDRVAKPEWDAELRKLMTFDSAKELTRIFAHVPDCFSQWFTFMNNIHIAKRVEDLILIKAQKDAFDGKGIFTRMPSYDFKKVVRLLNGEPLIQEAIQSKDFKWSKEIDEEFVRGLHLYGEPAVFKEIPIHAQIDLQEDLGMKYSKGHKDYKGGIHWGQRKLLMSEIDFFTHFLQPNEKAVVYYIGAAPFDHGKALLHMFPDLTFILCDPREGAWNEVIKDEAAKKSNTRVFIDNVWVTEEYIQDLAASLQVEDPDRNSRVNIIKRAKKFFFVSDIRSHSTTEIGTIDNELKIHEDMTLQRRLGTMLGETFTSLGKSFVASYKFRLPFFQEIGGADYEYGGGMLRTQPWSGIKSAELRLWWKPEDGSMTYNKKRLEDIMMYHNTVLREASFGHTDIPGYCECHDCHMEVSILKSYVSKFVPNIGTGLNGVVVGFVQLVDATMKMTLSIHADRDRKKTKFFRSVKNVQTGRARYDSLVETTRSNLAFEHRAEFVKVLKSQEDFKAVPDSKLQEAFSMSLLVGYYQLGIYNVVSNADIILEFTNVAPSETTIQTLTKLNDLMISKKDKAISNIPPSDASDVTSRQIGGGAGGFYNVATRSETSSATMSFHKTVFRRFLQGYERKYEMRPSEIRRESVVLARIYAILKRLAPAWSDHLAYSLDDFWEAHPEIQSFHNGGCLLSTQRVGELNYSDYYGALLPDLELGFTEYKNILQLNSLIVEADLVTIFAPPIRHLWSLFLTKALEILNKYRDVSRAILIIMPTKYVALISPELKAYEDESQSRDFVHQVFDTMKNKNVTLSDPHIVKVFRTNDSKFEIAKLK